jgi:hypothetical protein
MYASVPAMNSGGSGGLALAQEARCDTEASEPHLTGEWVREHVRRLDVLVNEPACVESAQRAGQSDRQSQKASDVHRPLDQTVQLWLRLSALARVRVIIFVGSSDLP